MKKNKFDRIFESDFVRLPRPLIRMFGTNAALMLSEIYSEYTYWKQRNELKNGCWFYSTVENMYNNTGLSKKQQLKAVKELQAYGIIDVTYRDVPRKRYFKFNVAEFEKLYYDIESISNCHSNEESEVIDEVTLDLNSSFEKRIFEGFRF